MSQNILRKMLLIKYLIFRRRNFPNSQKFNTFLLQLSTLIPISNFEMQLHLDFCMVFKEFLIDSAALNN